MSKYNPDADYLKVKEGKESFTLNGKKQDFNVLCFWQYHFSNLWNMTDKIAEFLVAKALEGKDTYTRNHEYWAVWDLNYRHIRIEIKATSDFHTWNAEKRKKTQRVFDIHPIMDRGYVPDELEWTGKIRRISEVYVFCHVRCSENSYDAESADPLNLDNWDFYIIPTFIIDKCCGSNKSISLGRVRQIHGKSPFRYNEIRGEMDRIYGMLSHSVMGYPMTR